MHILVTNDDGPPSALASPYILPFVRALRARGHVVSVVIPAEQRSWIGKAHIIGRDVATTPYWPEQDPQPAAAANGQHEPNGEAVLPPDDQPWVLVDSTPASCAQLGLSEFLFKDRGKVDLGRNTTAVFALSSGTLGAALEAAICGHRAIALSFAFFDRRNDPAVVGESCSHAVRVCEWLAAQPRLWHDDSARLYSVNVPVLAGVAARRTVWTRMLQNQWKRGACFQETDVVGDAAPPAVEEAKLRAKESADSTAGKDGAAGDDAAHAAASRTTADQSATRLFKWAPRFTDVYDAVEAAGPGSDGWAVKEGETSVTALRANFMHADGFDGELKL